MLYFHYEELKCFLSVKEIATILNVSIHTVYRLINSGELSTIKLSSRKTVIKADELERYINRK